MSVQATIATGRRRLCMGILEAVAPKLFEEVPGFFQNDSA
jgi:hypothetical protein